MLKLRAFIEWVRVRLPHVQRHDAGGLWCYRIYGLKPHFRLCLIDYTVATFYAGEPAWRRLRVCGMTVYERNRVYSGLPQTGRVFTGQA